MAFVIAVQIDLVESITGQPLVRIQNLETVQTQGPMTPMTSDLFVAAIERLSEDVTGRACEQARQGLNQT